MDWLNTKCYLCLSDQLNNNYTNFKEQKFTKMACHAPTYRMTSCQYCTSSASYVSRELECGPA